MAIGEVVLIALGVLVAIAVLAIGIMWIATKLADSFKL